MIWYIVLLAVLTVLVFLNFVSKKRIDKLIWSLSCFLIFLLMACRGETVGADTPGYIGMFKNIEYVMPDNFLRSNVFTGSFTMSVENGYLFYNWCLKKFITTNPRIIIITNSLLIVVALYCLLRRYSPYPMLSVWLYVTLGVFQTQMNMSRNAIAILICFLGVKFITKKQLIRYLLVITLASSIHLTAILFLPLYWLIDLELSFKKISMFFGTTFAVSLASTVLKKYFLLIIPERYSIYIAEETTDFSSFIVGIFYFFLILFIIYTLDRKRKILAINENRVGSWMAILNISLFILGYSFSFGTRVAALFGPYLILLIPQLIDVGIESRKKKDVVMVAVYLLCGVQYIMRLLINNIGMTMPYVFYSS